MRPFGNLSPPTPSIGSGAVVITPTSGENELRDALQSVQRQTYPELRHLVVADGVKHESAARAAVSAFASGRVPVDLIVLPRPTGSNGFFGHRIYGASAFLVDEEFIFFLDADNILDPVHVASCIAAMRATDASFAYSLRSIVDHRLETICEDNCDSLGFWPRYPTRYLGDGSMGKDQEEFLSRFPYLIDTSCYGVRRALLLGNAAIWHSGWGADSIFATELIRQARGVATGQRTVRYRLNTAKYPDLVEYFEEGNRLARELYGLELPWVLGAGSETAFVRAPLSCSTRFGPGAWDILATARD